MNLNTRENDNLINSLTERMDGIALDDQRETLLHYSREMADLIIQSHRALCEFLSKFSEWKQSRLELISYFEYLEKNLKESSTRFTLYRDMLEFTKKGASFVAAANIPELSIIARLISVFTGLFSVFLSKTEEKTAEVEESNDVKIAASRDTSASHDLYFYALKCWLQFEDTTKMITEFHSVIKSIPDPEIFEKESPEIAAFIYEILQYKPTHQIFFTRLHKSFQDLFQHSRSEFGNRFCEPFLLYSFEVIDIIKYLKWRLRHEDFNEESVRIELQQIQHLMESNDVTVKELHARIRSCVAFLEDELKFVEGCMKDLHLFEKSVQSGFFS